MAKFLEKSSIKAKISTSQALWGILILGVIGLNFAPINKNYIVNSFARENLGGPVPSLEQDSLLALASAGLNEPPLIENADNENSDALNQINPLTKKRLKRNSGENFSLPTIGWNWGQLHQNNAVDIANRCGTPIYAAKEGIVVEEISDNDWNSGYGNYIKIEHPNDIQTLYSHLEKNIVAAGQFVKEKEIIGYMGNTGNTHGPTGCHLHFEVYGAKNPLAN